MKVRAYKGPADLAVIYRLAEASFPPRSGDWLRIYFKSLEPSQYKNHRCLEVDGKVVSYLHVIPKRMRLGRALLRAGGIGAVCTDPAYRRKGCSRALCLDALEFMKEEGYDLSILFGIPDYYHRFGYASVAARHVVTLGDPVRDIDVEPLRFKMSSLRTADMEACLRLYNSQARLHDGNCLRRKMPKKARGVKIVDPKGRLAGYASWTQAEGVLEVRDAAARDAAAGAQLLSALRSLAERVCADCLSVDMPPGYPLTDAMLRFRATHHRSHRRNAGCMGRVIDLASLVRSMRREWQHLVSRSEFAARSRTLAVAVGDEVLRVRIASGKVSVSVAPGFVSNRVSPGAFAQLVLGYRKPAELVDDRDVHFAGRDLRILDVLFPPRNTYILAPDRF